MERVLQLFRNDMKKYFSNSSLFNIFKSNKRILLYLFEEQIITIDEFIAKRITSGKYIQYNYLQYFSPELRPFMNERWFSSYVKIFLNKLPTNFYENRRIGENDKNICKIIQKDLIDNFKSRNIDCNSAFRPSIYETNSFLLKQELITLMYHFKFLNTCFQKMLSWH